MLLNGRQANLPDVLGALGWDVSENDSLTKEELATAQALRIVPNKVVLDVVRIIPSNAV